MAHHKGSTSHYPEGVSNATHSTPPAFPRDGFHSPTAITGPVVGVVGGGQLARMMGPAATELGIELRVLTESADSCAVAAVAHHQVGDYRDWETLLTFAQGVDVVTFDHEHVPTEHLKALGDAGVRVHPQPSALVHAQDKIVMRKAVEALGLPNPRWAQVSTPEELIAFAAHHWPVVLKTPRGGYDGKGVLLVHSAQEVREGLAAQWLADHTFPALLAEEAVPFTRELSALVARSPSGDVRSWPVVESIQIDGVCDEVLAPAPNLDPQVAQAAAAAARTLATELGVTGVMAVELFEVPGGHFLINELAMRPHNSGHWTMNGSITGQFEQHLRAVLDLPLGDPQPMCEATVMKNILGGSCDDLFQGFAAAMTTVPAAKIHLYGKSVRPGRKVGHVNVTGESLHEITTLRTQAQRAADMIRSGERSSVMSPAS